jgi:hypothetical protein
MKTAEKYRKLYMQRSEEHFNKNGTYYPPRNWQEFEQWNTQTFQKHLAEDEPGSVLATKSYVGLLDHTKDFGFLHAIEKHDYALLNDVIYQTSRQELLDGVMTASGGGEGRILWEALPAFACNDFAVIEPLFPRDLPPSKDNHYLYIATQIFKALYYRQDGLLTDALEKAHAFLCKKQKLWQQYFVAYFVALANKDAAQLCLCLQQLCLAYQKLDKFIASDLDKCFSKPVHGLYRLVRKLDEALFQQIKRPDHPCFWSEFEDWQATHGYPQGKLFYTYPKQMDYLNQIFAAQIPAITLVLQQYSKDKFRVDEKKFALDLTENTKKVMAQSEML